MARRALLTWVVLHVSCITFCVAKPHESSTGGASLLAVAWQDCPPCGDLFTKADIGNDGKKTQHVDIQLRGEPKTGTTMMTTWAFGTLARTCEHLQDTYGRKSCRIHPDITEQVSRAATLTFEPGLSPNDDGTSCPCDAVDMVTITMSAEFKHRMPVDDSCRWQHPPGLTRDTFGCDTVEGRPVENYADIWACMEEASCEIEDDRLQFAPLRDPRAAAVSTYFHARRAGDRFSYLSDSVDDGVLQALPSVTQWIALRHILFEGLLASRSKTFWYEDANEDPLDWHFRWSELAGLRLPTPWIESISSQRLEGTWVNATIGVNPHPGGHDISQTRTWKDEVSPEIIPEMNSIVRKWLPGVLLARLGIP